MDNQPLHNYFLAAGFARRTMASLYDWLLVIASMMVLSTPVVAFLDDAIKPGNNLYRVVLVLFACVFFTGFWSYGGQTLGMKAWRLQLVRRDGKNVRPRDAFFRFVFACLSAAPAGLGYLWLLWDRDKLSWHDRWSGTSIKLLPKAKKAAD